MEDAKIYPMGLAQKGPDGSLYISESKKGKIWRIIVLQEIRIHLKYKETDNVIREKKEATLSYTAKLMTE